MLPPILQGIEWSGDAEQAESTAPVAAAPAPPKQVGLKKMAAGDAPAAKTTDDGGLQWRASALRRGMDEAKKSGQSLDDVLRERWGSAAELTGGMDP
eukprot:CAMPEP_0119289640 /NCGR_PEP_ID=MMETSP1329-20130426/39363_1 /TAXON_ID=114041 /ORGANISM="Genus nov. species nov., Strain RCC1024" /LENGTH=96 /DNA_ID=CAMNT_0007290447 /DNA_START=75 /DNA_END=362 /DNA_ORIENTATION=+